MVLRLLTPFVLAIALAATAAAQPHVLVITVKGSINPASAGYVHSAVEQAQARQSRALVIELNTPGGLLQSTREIVSDLLTSSIPIIVYVTPRGGQAASAGAFITMAAHMAVMAPGTNIGASHPVNVGTESSADSTNVPMTKATNDAAAFARSIAERRGRNIDMAERFVRSSESLTDREAVTQRVVDTVAGSLEELLRIIDGRVVSTPRGDVTIHTADVKIQRLPMSFRETLLNLLSDPNIAYILMMLGMYGLFFELYNPGAVFPGVVGGISIILALYSFNTLPVNYAGLALILLGVILFLLEIKVVSHGLLSIGGVISLFLGSLMLFDTPEAPEVLSVSLSVIVTITVCTALFFLFVISKGMAAQKRTPVTGPEGLIGEQGITIDALHPQGRVRVHGEYWNAISTTGSIAAGVPVIVRHVDSLLLIVESVSSPGTSPSGTAPSGTAPSGTPPSGTPPSGGSRSDAPSTRMSANE